MIRPGSRRLAHMRHSGCQNVITPPAVGPLLKTLRPHFSPFTRKSAKRELVKKTYLSKQCPDHSHPYCDYCAPLPPPPAVPSIPSPSAAPPPPPSPPHHHGAPLAPPPPSADQCSSRRKPRPTLPPSSSSPARPCYPRAPRH